MEIRTVVDAVLAKLGQGGAAAQKIQAERQKIAAEVGSLRGELAAGTPLTKSREQAAEKLRAAQGVLRAAEAVYNAAHAAEATWRSSLDGRIAALEGALRASASPKIAALKADLLEMHDKARNGQPLPDLIRRSVLGRKVIVGARTFGPSTVAQMKAILDALHELDQIALEPLSDEDLERRLDALLAEIPEIVEEQVMVAPAVA